MTTWTTFLRKHGGKGYTLNELSKWYRSKRRSSSKKRHHSKRRSSSKKRQSRRTAIPFRKSDPQWLRKLLRAFQAKHPSWRIHTITRIRTVGSMGACYQYFAETVAGKQYKYRVCRGDQLMT